ncbi:YfhO family protein [Parabacteroides sp. OttesenSCG-928-G07]|nr:YfhO family protein [Parabacteroides sp. OttesenSCG-928-G21]MDL2277814.1 YfhO family protein [Parabacteroides sp. OttesenSCG-928-G07]
MNISKQVIWDKVGKHIVAVILFLGLVMAYFSPAVFDGKVIDQSDNVKATGMGGSHVEKYAETAEPGEFSAWSDAMFAGMPYGPGYGSPAPDLPSFSIFDGWLKKVGYTHAAMIFTALVCFYILMCVMKVNWWLAIAGSIAFAFASYNIIIIQVGHIVKAYVIGYMPLTIAGMILLFRRSWLWGGVLFLLGVAYSLANGHMQITYYLVLLCLFIYIGYLVKMIKEKDYTDLIKSSLIMAACVILAVMPNAQHMYSNWELGKYSIRGPSELTPQPDETGRVEKASTGLDKDYAFQWSYGWEELLTVMIPNAYGGGTVATFGPDSELYKEMRRNGAQVGREIQSYGYWGDKISTSGPVYYGALVCFLFVLGMFVVRNSMKWWMFGGALFLTFLALGRNFDAFNDIMFHYLPLYNKFRTVEMALVIPGLVFPIVGIWGLCEIFRQKVDEAKMKKGFLWALGITGGICLLIWLMPGLLLDFRSQYDAYYMAQYPDWYYNALISDRESLASSDALRSLLFILAGAALLFWYWKAKNKQQTAIYVSAGMAILITVDLWGVDKRYLNDSHYVNESPTEVYKPRVADNEIFKDTDQSFRVLELANPFQSTDVSYFHHSIGGYHAVKLRRYQELIDHRLMNEMNEMLQGAETTADIQRAMANTPSLNMLNTRYVIHNHDYPPIQNPFAYGNAWFVEDVEIVENADAEIEALNRIDPLEIAVVDKRFAADLEDFTSRPDSTATIVLEQYRPNRLTYTSKAASEQLAVFSEIYYPGWKVTIDGQPASHFRADWTLRAMRIPAGEHTIRFEFLPEGYITAANVSAYSSFLILLLLIGVIGWSGWQVWKNYQMENKEEKAAK